MAEPRNGYLVLGMHRSGTSATTAIVSMLGVSLPRNLMSPHESNERGFFESTSIKSFNEELLLAAGTSWNDWRPFKSQWYETEIAADFRGRAGELLDAEFPVATPIVLKDPRICRIAPFWFSVFQQKQIRPYALIPFRSPLEVALSLRKLYGSSLNTGLLMWLRHNLDAEFFSRSYSRAFIHWPDLNENWKGTIAIAAERLGQPWPHFSNSAIADVDAFLSNRLWHNRIPISELDNHLEMHE